VVLSGSSSGTPRSWLVAIMVGGWSSSRENSVSDAGDVLPIQLGHAEEGVMFTKVSDAV
jgi:hypothetical protein